jgi:predicted RNA-binding protein YlqC (UPF0109 family)
VKELLETLVSALVSDPTHVRIVEHRDGDESLFEIDVDPKDRGRVIGKRGRTVEALRVLLSAAGDRKGLVVDVEVLD